MGQKIRNHGCMQSYACVILIFALPVPRMPLHPGVKFGESSGAELSQGLPVERERPLQITSPFRKSIILIFFYYHV